MSEFLSLVPTTTLENLVSEAEAGGFKDAEALLRQELQIRTLGSFALSNGVYDASQDVYELTDHPEDDRWFRSIN